jgi:hypothetical protein
MADDGLGSMPFCRKRSITSVAVAQTGSNVAHRDLGLDRADVMVVEDLDDLRRLDARHALRVLGVVHEQHAARSGIDEIRAGHQPNGPPRPVHRDRGVVVDSLICSEMSATRSSIRTVSGSASISARHGTASVISRALT